MYIFCWLCWYSIMFALNKYTVQLRDLKKTIRFCRKYNFISLQNNHLSTAHSIDYSFVQVNKDWSLTNYSNVYCWEEFWRIPNRNCNFLIEYISWHKNWFCFYFNNVFNNNITHSEMSSVFSGKRAKTIYSILDFSLF